MTTHVPGLSPPGKDVIGASSPVVQTIAWLERFFATDPAPDIGTDAAKACSMLAANHLLELMGACGLLNLTGKHSAAVVLLRPLEDALDCFAATCLVVGAAAEWERGGLKPSDAAKKWTPLREGELSARGLTLGEYRKSARGAFNNYSHCSYTLCMWDLYLRPAPHPETGVPGSILEINRTGLVIDRNAHAIDAHLTAHLLEFTGLVKRAYSKAIQMRGRDALRLEQLNAEVVEIMEQHDKHGCQDVRTPPELRGAGG